VRGAKSQAAAWDSINNRLLTTDIRLISGKTPVHSDMFIWSIDEPVDVGALQFANILFSVPQISTSIGQLPKDHLAMLTFYVAFWVKHRELLLDGEFTAHHPELNYPLLTAHLHEAWIAGVYAPMSIALPSDKKQWTLVNASGASGVVVTGTIGPCHADITDCMGKVVYSGPWKLDGVSQLPIPPCGTWTTVSD
jgi:alpha-galactosidase